MSFSAPVTPRVLPLLASALLALAAAAPALRAQDAAPAAPATAEISNLKSEIAPPAAPAPAAAEDAPASKDSPATEPERVIRPRASGTSSDDAPVTTRPGGSGFQMVVGALFLAGAGAWLFWRGRRDRALGLPGAGPRPDRRLAIAETRSLGNRQYLVVAAYEGRKFLLGVCPGRIDLLTALDTPPAAAPAGPGGASSREPAAGSPATAPKNP